MSAAADTDRSLTTVPLHNAVFCVDCEIISNSPHDVCTVCGSHSLIGLFRMLGGALRSQKAQTPEDHARPIKYDLELTVKVHQVAAADLNQAIESITHLANVGGDLEMLHINVESVIDTPLVVRKAA